MRTGAASVFSQETLAIEDGSYSSHCWREAFDEL